MFIAYNRTTSLEKLWPLIAAGIRLAKSDVATPFKLISLSSKLAQKVHTHG